LLVLLLDIYGWNLKFVSRHLWMKFEVRLWTSMYEILSLSLDIYEYIWKKNKARRPCKWSTVFEQGFSRYIHDLKITNGVLMRLNEIEQVTSQISIHQQSSPIILVFFMWTIFLTEHDEIEWQWDELIILSHFIRRDGNDPKINLIHA
jgi:hypothetical protein